MKLIVHADDFGMSPSIDAACMELIKLKTLSSASIMPNMPYAHDAREMMSLSSVSMGLHATFTQGAPLCHATDVSTLVDSSGNFWGFAELQSRAQKGKVDSGEVYRELSAQCHLLHEMIGDRLVFVDSHHGVHNRFPVFRDAFLRLRLEFPSIKAIRTRSFYYFKTQGENVLLAPPNPLDLSVSGIRRYLGNLTYRSYTRRYRRRYAVPSGMIVQVAPGAKEILAQLTKYDMSRHGEQVFYVVVHPAVSLDGLPPSNLKQERIDEYNFMKSSLFRDWVARNPLVHFGEIHK